MIETIISIINLVAGNYQMVISSIVAVLSGLITIALIIPGDQPEKFLQSVVDFLKTISRK